MSKRVNPEEKIVQFFNDTSLPEATVVFNIVNGIIKKRKAAELEQDAAPVPKKRRKARKVKPQTASSDSGAGDQDDSSEA